MEEERSPSQLANIATLPTPSGDSDCTAELGRAQIIQLLEQWRESKFLQEEASRQQPEHVRNVKFGRFLSEATQEYHRLQDTLRAAFEEELKEEHLIFQIKENSRGRLFLEHQLNLKQMVQDTRTHFLDMASQCAQNRERVRHEGQNTTKNRGNLRQYLLHQFEGFIISKAAASGIPQSQLQAIVTLMGPPPGDPGSYYWSSNPKFRNSAATVDTVSSCVAVYRIPPG